MYHWNQDNFNGLKRIGQAYAARDGFAGFSRYCLLREQGLKKPALKALDEFLSHSRGLEVAEQQAIACEIADLAFSNGDTHQLLSHALTTYLKQVFQAWCDAGAAVAEPFRWLGMLTGDVSWLETAVRHDPHDQVALRQLALDELKTVDFMTHHLHESVLLGSQAAAAESLNRASALALRIESEKTRRYLHEQVHYLREMLAAWALYQQGEQTLGFAQWCDAQGHGFSFSSTYYYSE